MLFRSKCGKLVEVVRANYLTDKEYYIAILKLK